MMADGNCYLLMKKLDEDCIDTIASKEICERLAYYNMTFNCYNVNKYHQFIDEVGVKREYTLLYMKFLNIDKRNLKEGIVATNKKVKKGVELLNKFFGEDSVYNITGMGFLVYYEGDKNTLGSRLLKFHNALKECQLEILATYYNHPKDEPHLATLNKVRELLRVLDDKNNLRILKEKMVQREAEQRE